MCLIRQFLAIFHNLRFFSLPLIVKNIFEKLVLHRIRGVNTSLVSDWVNVFQHCDILKFQKAAGSLLIRHLN